MFFSRWIRLFYECFKLAGLAGLKACMHYMTGDLVLDETTLKSCNFPVGGSDV